MHLSSYCLKMCDARFRNKARIILTRRMYWRRASIHDGQAFTSAWRRHCSETVFFRDNFVNFRRRSKRIAFLESVNLLRVPVCKFSIFLMSRDHFSTPFRAYICQMPNAWSQTLQTSKRHTFRVSAFHRYHWFGVKLFPIGCAQDSRRVP